MGNPDLHQEGPSAHSQSATLPEQQLPEPLHSRTHLPALDGIRGIAILLVFIYHSVRYSGVEPTVGVDRFLHRLSLAGWSGVDLFFVLSGFLITGILYDAKGGDGYFRNFYVRRILRIFPLYYGFLFFFFVVLPSLVPLGQQFSSLVKDRFWYWTYLTNVSIAIKGWPPAEALVHFWSLAVEEQFYLIWPWVVFFLSRGTLMLTCVGIMAWSLGLRVAFHAIGHPLAAYVLTPSRMDALALGGLIALIAREPGGFSRLARWARPAVVASAVSLGVVFIWRHGLAFRDVVVQTVGFTLLAILFGGVLVIALTSPPGTIARRLFAHRWLRFLGRYSYSLYVFHHPIMYYTARFFNVGSIPRIAGSRLLGQLSFAAVAASISLTAAISSWHLYEAQFLKLKALFPYHAKASDGPDGNQASGSEWILASRRTTQGRRIEPWHVSTGASGQRRRSSDRRARARSRTP